MIRRATMLLGIAGLLVATALFLWQGVTPVLGAFAAAGIGILWASLFHFVSMALNAWAWQVLLPARRRASVAFFLWAVWLRESVNGLLPVARIGGEVASARVLMRHGMRAPKAVASLVLDMTASLVSQAAFTLLGLALLLAHGAGGDVAGDVALGLIATVPLFAALVLAQRAGFFGMLARLFRLLFGDRFDALVGGAVPLDRAVRRLYRRRAALAACFLWQLAGWVAGAGEVWLALVYLGHPVGFADAVIVEAMIQALSSGAFVVPGALGIQEGGFLVMGGVIGLTPELSLALALARRARDVIVFVPALAIWQLGLGRRARQPRDLAQRTPRVR
ncbi:MAG TPA: lysylphosphatidylglycerol synthase domain-containing protein [Stellaceae bacterium]|nr:lysylphosphatidylglycerol synthase domain-containing protein [Stellaceae bacterium]